MNLALNLRLVDAGPGTSAYATNTDDDCGSGNTGSDACTGDKIAVASSRGSN